MRRAKLFVVLRRIRHELCDDAFQEELAIYCKAWPVRNGDRFLKTSFQLNFEQGTIRCPNAVSIPFTVGQTVHFPEETCAVCPLRVQCTSSAGVQGQSGGGYGVEGISVSGTGIHALGATGVQASGNDVGVSSTGSNRGGIFAGAAAQLQLVPNRSQVGHPTAGQQGDLYLGVDANSNLTPYLCTLAGSPTVWKRVQLV